MSWWKKKKALQKRSKISVSVNTYFNVYIYFKNLDLFFKIIPLGIISIVFQYCIYSITKYMGIICNKLDKYYDVQVLSTNDDEENYKKNNILNI